MLGMSMCLLHSSFQCGSRLQDENLAVMQSLLFDNAAVNFCHIKK